MKYTLASLLLGLVACAGPTGSSSGSRDLVGGPAEPVVQLYDLVTVRPGRPPDWDAVRALFLEEAVVVLRTGRDELSVFSLEGFIDDFVQFIEQARVLETGFTERILDLRVTRFGDIAHVLVRFDSHLPGSGRAPSEGLDSFELVRLDGRWKIVSITNERPTADHPIPDGLLED